MATINAVGVGLKDSTGTGKFVGDTSATLVTPNIGTPSAGTLTNCTGLTETGITLADNTTNNASTSNHGFLKKLDNNASHFMNGQGNWVTPASGADAFVDQTGSAVTMAINTVYLADKTTLVTLTLPTTSAVGSWVEICGYGTGLFTIAQATGQKIYASPQTTTTGTGGSLSSTGQYDTIKLRCVVADTEWTVVGSQGQGFTYV